MAVHMISGKECVALRDSLVKHLFPDRDDKENVSYADVVEQYDVNIFYCNIVVTEESDDDPADENHENSGTIVVSVTKKDLENPSNQDQTANKNNVKSLLDEVFNSTNESGDVIIMDNRVDAYLTIFLKLNDPKYKLEGVRLTRWNTIEAKYHNFEVTKYGLDISTNPIYQDLLVFSKGAFYKSPVVKNFLGNHNNISIPNDASDKSFLTLDAMAHFMTFKGKCNFYVRGNFVSICREFSNFFETVLNVLDPSSHYKHGISIADSKNYVVGVWETDHRKFFIFDHSISKDTRSSWNYVKDNILDSKNEFKIQDTTTKQAKSNWKTYLLWGCVVIACLVLVGLIIYLAYVIISK